jgi:hypothetical protein
MRGIAGRNLSATTIVVAASLVGVGAQAAITMTSSSNSDVTVDVLEPPVTFEKGENADDKRWFNSFSMSTNKTSFSATVKPRVGGHSYIHDVVRTLSQDDQDRTITLTGSQESNAKVERFQWRVYNGSNFKGVMDHTASNPSAQFTLPSQEKFRLDLEIDLEQGAGKKNAGISFWVQLEVT